MNADRFGGMALHDALRNNHKEIAEYLEDYRVENSSEFDSYIAE